MPWFPVHCRFINKKALTAAGQAPGPQLFLRTFLTEEDWEVSQQHQAALHAERAAAAAARTADFRLWTVRLTAKQGYDCSLQA
jgi:hypothetical protein